LDTSNVRRLAKVPDDAGLVVGGGDGYAEFNAGRNVVDGVAVRVERYKTVASTFVKLEREISMLEGVPDGQHLAGFEAQPDVSIVRADVDCRQLVVNVVAKRRQNRFRRRIFLEPDVEVAIC